MRGGSASCAQGVPVGVAKKGVAIADAEPTGVPDVAGIADACGDSDSVDQRETFLGVDRYTTDEVAESASLVSRETNS